MFIILLFILIMLLLIKIISLYGSILNIMWWFLISGRGFSFKRIKIDLTFIFFMFISILIRWLIESVYLRQFLIFFFYLDCYFIFFFSLFFKFLCLNLLLCLCQYISQIFNKLMVFSKISYRKFNCFLIGLDGLFVSFKIF